MILVNFFVKLYISLGPKEQFNPIALTPNPSIKLTNVSKLTPAKVRISASKVMVVKIFKLEFSLAARTAAFNS